MKLRAAVLGCGSFGGRHARVLAGLPEHAELVAFCGRDEVKAKAFSNEFTGGRAAAYTDSRHMMEDANLDLLVVCLPPSGHGDEVAIAAQHGVHLLMEKPIALTSADGWKMVEAAERAGIKTQVGFMSRFGAVVEAFKAFQEGGEAGPVGMFDAQYFCNSLHSPWWREKEKSGGQLLEQVIHHVDLLRYLMGEPQTVYARMANLFHQDVPGYTIEDISVVVARFAGGPLGVLRSSNAAIPGRYDTGFNVIAQKVTVQAQNHNSGTIHFTTEQKEPLTIASEQDCYAAQMLDLVGAIRDDRPARTPIREGALSLDLAVAAVRSAEAMTEVAL
ncbi:Gfo/Idh/MocA family protein [Deinococcus marmoris]|uniref:Myo-inositol 2-dehydrogenase 1 n=1 Tax=Deinococcus marmoris TaxID=249408 RepID=A0A1U7NR60_9DEIO|nr:Gfo/Idh/MocA family oxidoreductase [Deinococcus marmoris]OLV15394.1 Myo-inositol 2-dehydrogenase 1 [Deinococcus marmoris]